LQGEHGVGLGKMKSLLQELGEDTVDVMRQIKKSLDPHWLMNPGKIFAATRDGTPHDSMQATASSGLQQEWDES
jgi:D-lactate dehydrogenase (cytochrome)